MGMYDLPPYVDRCTFIRLDTLTRRRSDACVMFVFDVLSGRVGSPNLLSLVNVIATALGITFSCGLIFTFSTLNDAVRHFNEVAGLFDFYQFFNPLKSVL
jgi:hypothetical protein